MAHVITTAIMALDISHGHYRIAASLKYIVHIAREMEVVRAASIHY